MPLGPLFPHGVPLPLGAPLPWDVYISSSWKNRERVRAFADAIRAHGLRPYDFTDITCRTVPELPPEKFPQQFDPATMNYREYIDRPEFRAAVECNRKALDFCRAVVLLLPCGLDAHADWAYGVGRGMKTVVVGAPKAGDRVPTHLWTDKLLDNDAAGIEWCVNEFGSKPAR